MARAHDTMMNPPIEDLLDTVDSKFSLVTLAARRARQINSYFNQLGDGLGHMVPPQVSSIARKPLSIGLNCALGAKDLRTYMDILAQVAPDTYLSCHPNAGLPNAFGGYDETPEDMAKVLREFAEAGLINIVGGCCGTTPPHISAIAQTVADVPVRQLNAQREAA